MASLTEADVRAGILSGAINHEKLASALTDLRLYAYSYLYNLQKDMVGIIQIDAKYEDFTTRQDNVFTGIYLNSYKEFNVKIPFIHHNLRLKFRRSKFYNIPITNKNVEKNRDLFIYSYFVFVDGILDTSAKIRCKEELTSICLRKEAMTKELQEHFVPGANISIVFIPDVRSENLSATKLELQAAGMKFSTSYHRKFNDVVFVFVSKGNGIPKMYSVTQTDNEIVLPDTVVEGYENMDTLDITAVIVPNKFSYTDLAAGERWFEPVVDTNMPVPTENVMVFKCEDDGSMKYNANVSVERKYPNKFAIDEEHKDDTHRAYVFYWDNYANRDMKYESEDIKYRSIINVIAAYASGEVNEDLASFIPYLYSYDNTNFHQLDYIDKRTEPLLYRANKLFDAYKLWAYASQLYYEKMCEETSSYLIYTEKLDMESKIRKNNKEEVRDKAEYTEFENEHYLFVFANTDLLNKLPYKFWVDGVRVVPEHIFLDGKYEYVYMDKSLFKEDSVIEIERSANSTYMTKVSSGPAGIHVNFANAPKFSFPFRSLYVTDSEGVYIDPDTLKFAVIMDDGVEYEIPKNSTMLITNETKLFVYSTVSRELVLRFSDKPIQLNRHNDISNWFEENLNGIGLIRNIPKQDNRIRVFQKGRLLPSEVVKLEWPEDSNDALKVWIDFPGMGIIGDFQVDYIPEGYNRIYYTPELSDPKGLLDLSGVIDKPFSMKYYDVYVNGYRLLPRQIERISNFVIQIKNIETVKKLAIYEKDIVSNGVYVLDIDDAKNFLADKLYQNDEDFRKKLREYIEDIIPDVTIEDADKFEEILEFIVNSIVDYLDIHRLFANDELEEEFFEKYRPFFNSDVFFIDANKTYPYGYPEDPNRVYFLAPQRKTELEGINSPSYVKQFALMMEMMGMQFINANDVRPEISDRLPKIKLQDNDDPVIMISGNMNTERFTKESKLLTPQ